MNTKRWQFVRHLAAAAVLVAFLPGCDPRPVQGGTEGQLLAAGAPLSDIQLTVFQRDGSGFSPLGFGVTTTDGSFKLFLNLARGPLVLPAGDYRFTLESAGAPVEIPQQYAAPETTPLAVSWKGEGSLKLEIAEKLIP
jgi:hypothetical protein